MEDVTKRLENLIKRGVEYISKSTEEDLTLKPSPEKWSKKEILGHLIDSAVNNLQRFTEIQFENKPYKVRDYKQNELVTANNYNNVQTLEILDFWVAINNRILSLVSQQTQETLSYKINVNGNDNLDLRFLILDYVNHLEHHLDQIFK